MANQELVIEEWTDAHPRWPELMALQGVQDLDLESKRQPWHLETCTVVAVHPSGIAGVLRFWTQVIGVDEDRPPHTVEGSPAIEAKVVTLHVVEGMRRQGIGTELQLAAVRRAADLGCYQLRSRSKYRRHANHAMKASLGFAVSPGTERPDSHEGSAYFVLPLRLHPRLAEALQPSTAGADPT